MIVHLSKIDRLFGLSHRLLLKNNTTNIKIINKVENFLEKYCYFFNITPKEVASIVNKFQKRYAKDVKRYLDTGKYPHELNVDEFLLSREEYDVVLLCSILTSSHRHKIINRINLMSLYDNKIAVIGVGSGVELLFINASNTHIDAYDLSISDFAKKTFCNVNFFEHEFRSSNCNYNVVYAIEILEHLKNPFLLLREIYDSLAIGGKCVFTTTTNVPQFDHLYDFKVKELAIELSKIGFKISDYEILKHESNFANIDASNAFFIVEKFEL
jgi:hypothetical protein